MPFAPMPSLPETPRERDARLVSQYKKATGFAKEQKLEELLDALAGPIGTAVNTFRGAPLPSITMQLEAKRIAAEAVNDFDPSQGVALATFVTTRVKQRLSRYVGTYQNTARLPEAQIQKIGPIREAVADLTTRLGREPSTEEIADHLGLSLKHVARIRKNLRADLLEETGGLGNLDVYEQDEGFDRAMMVYYQLTNQEKQVFDYLLGAHGQQRLRPLEIANRLGISAARVSSIKETIAKKIQPYLEGT